LGIGITLLGLFQTDLLEGTVEMWEIPSNHVRRPGHYNTSLSFPSPELAVIADGAGTLHVVSTGSRIGIAGLRVDTVTWKVSKI
jgi:hypothetical protein